MIFLQNMWLIFAAGLPYNRIICGTTYRVSASCSAQDIQRFELPRRSIVLCLQINQECGLLVGPTVKCHLLLTSLSML